MATVIMYSTQICPFCQQAEQLLSNKGIAVTKIWVDVDPERRQEMINLTGRRTVPQIFINEKHIGGYDDLYALDQRGELDPLLAT